MSIHSSSSAFISGTMDSKKFKVSHSYQNSKFQKSAVRYTVLKFSVKGRRESLHCKVKAVE